MTGELRWSCPITRSFFRSCSIGRRFTEAAGASLDEQFDMWGWGGELRHRNGQDKFYWQAARLRHSKSPVCRLEGVQLEGTSGCPVDSREDSPSLGPKPCLTNDPPFVF